MAAAICFWVSEKFLYDLVIFQRSWLHGYGFNYASDTDAQEKSPAIKKILFQLRNNDLLELFEQQAAPTYSIACNYSRNINNHRQFTTNKPLKIVIIGDSNAYGMGVLTQQRLGKKLENNLNKYTPTKVWTLAEPGNSIEEFFSLYQLAENYFSPDIFLISMLENDFRINEDFRYTNTESIRASFGNKCGQLTLAPYHLRLAWNKDLMLNYPLSTSNSSNYCYADQLVSAIVPAKTLFFKYSPSPNIMHCELTSNAEYCLYGAIMDSYTDLVSKKGIEVIENSAFLPDKISELEGHPSSKEHQELADYLAQIIVKKLDE